MNGRSIMTTPPSDQELNRIETLMRELGGKALAMQPSASHRFKDDQTYITAVDKEVESTLAGFIVRSFPGHRILGEEGGFKGRADSPWTWVIDPIDGTSNYALGLPLWSVSVGLLYKGRPRCGWIYLPVMDEMFMAAKGRGALLNGRPIHCGQGEEMRPQDLFGVDTRSLASFDFSFPQDARALGSAAMAACYAACGRYVGFFLATWYIWDIAAALIIAREAGLRVSTMNGQEFSGFGSLGPQPGPSLLFARPALHKKLLDAIAAKPGQANARNLVHRGGSG
jgi:myo-inositol-1(or 4)-monophosphatase